MTKEEYIFVREILFNAAFREADFVQANRALDIFVENCFKPEFYEPKGEPA